MRNTSEIKEADNLDIASKASRMKKKIKSKKKKIKKLKKQLKKASKDQYGCSKKKHKKKVLRIEKELKDYKRQIKELRSQLFEERTHKPAMLQKSSYITIDTEVMCRVFFDELLRKYMVGIQAAGMDIPCLDSAKIINTKGRAIG